MTNDDRENKTGICSAIHQGKQDTGETWQNRTIGRGVAQPTWGQ